MLTFRVSRSLSAILSWLAIFSCGGATTNSHTDDLAPAAESREERCHRVVEHSIDLWIADIKGLHLNEEGKEDFRDEGMRICLSASTSEEAITCALAAQTSEEIEQCEPAP